VTADPPQPFTDTRLIDPRHTETFAFDAIVVIVPPNWALFRLILGRRLFFSFQNRSILGKTQCFDQVRDPHFLAQVLLATGRHRKGAGSGHPA